MDHTADPIAPVSHFPDFLDEAESRAWFDSSRALPWSRDEISMYGKKIPVPREEALFGDDLPFKYRGESIKALGWPAFLLDARDRIEKLTGFTFHFAVGNRYMTGRDSIGWHSDDFPQIGERPPIASLSLGDARRFKLKRKADGVTVDYELTHGSLLVMLPGCQDDWLHAVPKTSRPVGERINWTFRPHVDGAPHH